MSDPIKHECGIAFVRLRKPLEYYVEKYGTAFYGLNKMYLLMEKQRNRGQDGAGLANIKLNTEPGTRYISRYRSVDTNSIGDIFGKVQKRIAEGVGSDVEKLKDRHTAKGLAHILGAGQWIWVTVRAFRINVN